MSDYVEAQAGNQRLVRDQDGDVLVTLYVDGVAADVSGAGAAVTVAVVNAAGTTVAASGAATDGDTGVYRRAIAAAAIPDVTVLTATWTVVTGTRNYQFVTTHEVVGGHVVTLGELRSFGRRRMASTSDFTEERLDRFRTFFDEFAYDYCGVAFTPRYRSVTLDGSGTDMLRLPDREVVQVFSATVDGVAVTVSDLKVYASGRIQYASGWTAGYRNVVVNYEHGFTKTPHDIRRAACLLADKIVVPGDTPATAFSVTDETGTYHLAMPGEYGRPTGVPEVDTALNRYRQPGIV